MRAEFFMIVELYKHSAAKRGYIKLVKPFDWYG